MDTKTLILKTALELYNSQGVHTITSRHIAAKMGISPGNLHYHFKHTDEIIRTLYTQLSADFDAIVSVAESPENVQLETIHAFFIRSFELVYKYRFIFLHFVEISLRIPDIRKDYYALTQRREKQFIAIFEELKSRGIFRKDLTETLQQALVTQIFIMGDFWLSNNELTLRLRGSKAIKHYSNICYMMFYPYLTPSARSSLRDMEWGQGGNLKKS
ncbi:TetR/AcrR family transcriptional regulator [Chitinophaga nivalis]|uniref:TetR/AcrR family transcriptional regulator n=1 Tax=Chitinophaga nivalis TaxID=2991709 RepID=A0ABT3IS61_9BACT|nr:TetR/AcrR family transcriptional regulator [Chitinophaga nivalis]MCW3463493.1 TetR/AcrR family transcriptional regulator [Chitinophaga nivalis]MCW3486817.1 TetR/AcrR family transcriptional regulator [Chitinophaga nivalis]